MNDAWKKAEGWLRPGSFASILALLVIAQFPRVIIGLETFFFRDYGFFGYPLGQFHRDAFWSGQIPFWNPYNNAGLPFLAQWNTLVLYPGSLIYLLLPLPWSLGIFCLAHQFLAGLGMYFLGRDSAKSNLPGAVAGIAYAFCGLLLCSLKWPNNIAAFGWMPWVVWRCLAVTDGRTLGIAALVGGAQMLTGAPEVILLTWVIVGVLLVGESIAQRSARPVLFLAAIVGLVTLIAAAQLWPFWDLLKISQRTVRFAGSDWPMPIWGWANFILPLFGTFPSYHGVPAQPNQYWTSTYYVPLAALAFVPFSWKAGWRARALMALALFGAMMALGEAGGLYAALRHVAPGLGFMRFPIKFVILPVFILPWLCAWGIGQRPVARQFYLPAALFAILAVVLAFLSPAQEPSQPPHVLISNGAARALWLAMFAISFTIFLRAQEWRWALVAMVATICIDALTHAPEQNPTAANWVFDRGLPQIKNPPRLGAGRAMLTADAALKLDHLIREKPEDDIGTSRLALFCNDNLIDRLPKVDGFFSLYPHESAQLIDFIYANTNRSFPGLEKLLCVSHRTARGKTGEWIETPTQLWISGGQKPMPASRADTIQALLAPEFDPSDVVYLPVEIAPETNLARTVEIRDVNWTAHKITFTTKAEKPAWLVLSQTFHEGWSAKANGAPAKLVRADHAFQGVLAPAGETHFELVYREPHFAAGVALSAVGALVAALLVFKRP
jgi:hypothetical protein